jgi:hypothetical protein
MHMSTGERYARTALGYAAAATAGVACVVVLVWRHSRNGATARADDDTDFLHASPTTTVVKAGRNTETVADGDAALTLTLAVASDATLTIGAKRSAYLKAVAMDPRCSLAWYKLGAAGGPDPSESHSTLSNDEELANANSIPAYECTRRALEIVLASDAAPPRGWSIADGYHNLGVDLQEDPGAPSTVTLGGERLDAVECLRRAVAEDPADVMKWFELAHAIDTDDGTDGTAATAVVIRARTYTARAIFALIATARLERSETTFSADWEELANAWIALGVSLSSLDPTGTATAPSRAEALELLVTHRDLESDESELALPPNIRRALSKLVIDVAGGALTPLECFFVALRLEPRCERAWGNVAESILDRNPGHAAVIKGDRVELLALAIACAIELNPTEPSVWTMLATIIEAGVPAAVGAGVSINGRPLSQWRTGECFVQAVQHDPSSAESWYNAAISNPNGCTLRLPDRPETLKVFSALECLMKAVERRPEWADAWIKIGEERWIAASRRHGSDHAGTSAQSEVVKAFRRAVLIDEGRAEAWHGLAAALEDGETVEINGVNLDRIACAMRRNELTAMD